MNKKEFINLIDNNFPYNNIEKSINLVDKAIKIGPECVYYILHELVRIPKSKKNKVSLEYINQVIDYIDKIFLHRYKDEFLSLIRRIMKGKTLGDKEILNYINKFEHDKSMIIPINILYFLSEDENGEIESKFNEIHSKLKN